MFRAGHITGSKDYQTAKAMIAASRILARRGRVILFSDIRDGIGAGTGFVDSMRLLRKLGAEGYLARVLEDGYPYQPEEWQTVMLARALRAGIRDEAVPDHDVVVATHRSEQGRHADLALRFRHWDGTPAGAQALLGEELTTLGDDAVGAVMDDETVVPTLADGVLVADR